MRKLKFKKKHIPLLIMAVACTVVAILCLIKAIDEIKYNEQLFSSSLIDTTQTLLIADGGNGTEIPKNTKYAVDDLMQKGFFAVKIDARLTGDKKWVSLESEDISVVTDGKGNVKDYTYFDLLNHNIKDFRPNEFPVIELVSNTAKYASDNGILPVIYFHDYNKSAIKALYTKLTGDNVRVLYFASDDMRVLEYLRKLDATAPLLYHGADFTDEEFEKFRQDGNMTIGFDFSKSKSTKTLIEKAVTEEIPCLCFGAETLKDIESLYKLGVRYFITDTVMVE